MDINYGGSDGSIPQINVCFGDGNTQALPRTTVQILPGDGSTVVNDYEGIYTYGSSGTFQIAVASDQRSLTYLNYQNPEAGSAFIWTVLNTQLANSTPVLPYLNFSGAVRQVFAIDLKPTVADQDSISVRVQRISKASPGTCGVRMLERNYQFPNEVRSTGTFKVDTKLKQLVWKAPEVVGNYIFAMVVYEWRDGVVISETYREGTINVIDKPGPNIEIPPYESSEYGGLITSAPDVESPEVSMAIQAYPVPTDDFVTVKAYSKKRSIIKLQLIDMNGRIIREISSASPEILMQEEFDMRRLARGIYLIKASNSIDAVSQKVIR